jgi:hypothetical protein
MQWAICQTPYARLKYAKSYDHCYVFSMTTEQVGYFVIYISIIRLWLSILPLQEEITIIPPGLQFISQVSGISVWRHIMARAKFQYAGIFYPGRHILYPGRHILCPDQHILYPGQHILCPGQHILYLGQHILYLRSQLFQFLSTSGY